MAERQSAESGGQRTLMFLALILYIAIALYFLAGILVTHWPSVLLYDGGKNQVRNFFELLYFALSGIGVPAVAVWAVLFAKRQAQEAERARLASVYMGITDRWNSTRLIKSRMHMVSLSDKFEDSAYSDPEKAQSKTVQEYVKRALLALERKDRAVFVEKIQILIFLEDLGVLCDKQYVNQDDIFEFIAAPISWQMELLKDYVGDEVEEDAQAYVNARRLWASAQAYKPSGI